jgi:hypothetical protein
MRLEWQGIALPHPEGATWAFSRDDRQELDIHRAGSLT